MYLRPSLSPPSLRVAASIVALWIAGTALGCVGDKWTSTEASPPWPIVEGTWRDDPTWYDGFAEVAVYDATRVIYGEPRHYRATAYTNKQRMDPATTTKAEGSDGVEVFKHHWSERVPTERYDYDFSTAVFTRTADLSTFKWTCATQEDCGASFKQAWSDGDGWRLFESTYFPGEGMTQGRRPGPLPLSVDALTLVLRDFPVDTQGRTVRIALLPSQRDTHRVPWTTVELELVDSGIATIEVPYGTLEARRIDLCETGAKTLVASYWFAIDDSAPLLGALLRFEDRDGRRYELVSLERYPYWARGPR
ncbi:hypothetical protein [Engelhardtia mirabilis]|uniref:DUF3108 domain-containing protein n=1 Tax=Engelhardtia mirabilis TaxID=2528011 RepID=A0A518BM28_9BACT|nr:hypothetical protein Pla133_31220 [Planctomycetes bacterium Pla133]QDV02357.1 hypothetical protein Pla86_31210 [Planctomycetes bacterium Pla86]